MFTGILKHNFSQSLNSKSFLFYISKLYQFQISQVLEDAIWFSAELMENRKIMWSNFKKDLKIKSVYYKSPSVLFRNKNERYLAKKTHLVLLKVYIYIMC